MRISKGIKYLLAPALLGLVSFLLPAESQAAGLGLAGTRVVFHEHDKSQSVTLYNRGDTVYLIQSSLMNWGTTTPASDFAVLPPLFRLEPHNQGSVRLVRTGDSLPHDRESVFQFVARGIEASKEPLATKDSTPSASLGISLGFAIKMFWRPDGLAMSPSEAYERLTFRSEGGKVVVHNPTPYYQTFATLSVGGKKVNVAANDVQQMVAPQGSVSFPLPEDLKGKAVRWTLIDDSGSLTPEQKGEMK